jgi:hypothetical protein
MIYFANFEDLRTYYKAKGVVWPTSTTTSWEAPSNNPALGDEVATAIESFKTNYSGFRSTDGYKKMKSTGTTVDDSYYMGSTGGLGVISSDPTKNVPLTEVTQVAALSQSERAIALEASQRVATRNTLEQNRQLGNLQQTDVEAAKEAARLQKNNRAHSGCFCYGCC